MIDVSIIIPTFNRASFITDAIDSALAQGDGVEVIVVDDGSTDGTAGLLEGFGARIRVLRQVNQGPSVARNLGAGQARGEYLFFADSDDLIEPGAVSRLLEAARAMGPGKIPFGQALTFDDNGHAVHGVTYGHSAAPNRKDLDLASLLSATMPLCLTLLPATLFHRLGGLRPDLRLGEDHEFALRVHAAGFRYVATKVPAIRVRIHDGPRLSGSLNPQFAKRAVELWTIIAGHARQLADLDGPAARVLAKMIWIAGRDAARTRSRQSAEQLFALAASLDEKVGRESPLPLRLVGRSVGPYRAERLAEAAKYLLRRR